MYHRACIEEMCQKFIAWCRERDGLEVALAQNRAQMQLLVEADMEAIQV